MSDNDLAAFHIEKTNQLALYRSSSLNNVLSVPDLSNLMQAAMDSQLVVGYLRIELPKDDCGDSMELTEIWGPGYGDLLVDLAFALSPSHSLVIDRKVVTDKGAGMWKRIASRVKVSPLPKTCSTYHKDPDLNVIYSSRGNPTVLRVLKARHDAAMNEASKDFNIPPKKIENVIMSAGWEHFNDTLPLR